MTKQERREAMPEVTAWVDEIRKAFGDFNAIKATENGHSIEWRKQVEVPK